MNAPLSLRTFAWLSHERPEALRRSIGSFIEGAGEAASSYRYIVAESGRFQSGSQDIPSPNVVYINDAYREKLIGFLERGLHALGARKEAVRFALDGRHPEGSEGAHRNAIALLTGGEPFACADDDVIFDIRSLPPSAKGQTRPGTGNFLPFPSFADLDDFEAQARTMDVAEFIAAHEKALQEATFSSPGIRGDSAYGGPRFILTFDDASLESFCRNKDFVARALGSRVMWRETAVSHLVPYASIATYMLGVNGRNGLAPCFPFGRNVDGAFVYATKALHPASRTAHLSCSVSHRPLADRGPYAGLHELDFRINDLLWLMWSEWLLPLPVGIGGEERCKRAAVYFQGIAALSPVDFHDFLVGLSSRTLSDRALRLEAQIERLQSKRQAPGLPAWIKVAGEEARLCRKMAFEKALPTPVESRRQDRSLPERLELTRQWIRSYGQLIEAWPLMRALAAGTEAEQISFHH
ncbi:MAG: hypothetical protein KF865_04960 [Bdellovibrionaceae bacterium]|nr:hypothetical protein [Pseudobdellovibrionaceae bacterium]